MKKIVVIVLVVIGASVAAAPYVNGLVMEQVLRNQVERINELNANNPYGATVEIANIDRGFYSSVITWKINLAQLKMLADIDDIVLVETAKHGYMGVTSVTSLDQNTWFANFVRDELGGKHPLTIATSYDLFNGVKSTISVEPFELHKDEKSFLVRPGQIVVNVDRAFKHFVASANLAGFSVPGEFDVADISLASDIDMISHAIMDGTSSVLVKKVAITGECEKAELTNLKVDQTLDYDAAANALSVGVTYAVEHLVAGEKQVDDLHVNIGVNRIDAAGFENFTKAYASTLKDFMATFAEAKNDPEKLDAVMQQKAMLMGMQLATELEKLLKEGLQIQVSDLHVRLPEGDIDGSFELGLKKDMTFTNFILLSQQPKELLHVFSMRSNLTLPNGLIEEQQQEQLLAPMMPGMQGGLFVLADQKLAHQAEIKDDKLYLNGQEIVLNF